MQQLVVGNVAEVEIRAGSYVRGGKSTYTYTGAVLQSESYDPPNSFRLMGDRKMPVRVISMSLVVKLNGLEMGASAKTRTFDVAGSKPGTVYKVVLDETGQLICTCNGFGFRKSCRHTADVEAYLKGKA